MPSKKSRKHPSPSSEPEELWVLRSQLEAGQIAMTRKLMLRVVDELSSSLGSGVNLFDYYITDVDEETRKQDQLAEVFAFSQRVDDSWESWYRCAHPEWLDVMADILIDPPLAWGLDEDFANLFLNVAGQFPEKAVQVLAVLFSDEKVHPRLKALIQTLHTMHFD